MRRVNSNPQINLAIVGGQKCGTTALADFIAQHPDVFVVNGKEGHVFDAPDIDSLSAADIDARYQLIKKGYNGERWVCDATPIYAYWQDIPRRLVKYSPNIKVVFITRDPVDRAVSHYFMEKNQGDEPLGILRAFLYEKKRLIRDYGDRSWSSSLRHHSYLDRGLFGQQISNLKRNIAPENLLLLDNKQLSGSHKETLNCVFKFLGEDQKHIPNRRIFEGDYRSGGLDVRLARLYARWKFRREANYSVSAK